MNALSTYRSLKAGSCMPMAFVLAVLATSLSQAVAQQTQPAMQPFVAPPVLEETTPGAPAMQFLRLSKPAPEEKCHPQGSVRRTGNDVFVKLDFVLAKFAINNPDPNDPYRGNDPVELRSYGGCHSGPTIEVLPGNTLHIDLINDLSPNDPSCQQPPLPAGLGLPPGVGCFNTINLHTHGLHVSPAGNSDNVLLSITPQTEFPYEYEIPSDHPAGTFWYHAHRHGSTAMQVASGASGILIIRGTRLYTEPTADNPHPIADIDTILHDRSGTPFTEQLFLMQQIPYACFDNDPNLKGGPWQQIFTTNGLFTASSPSVGASSPANSPWICPKPDGKNHATVGVVENFGLQMFSPSIWDTNGRFTTVNGIVQPLLTVKAGEVQRWRFVHAGLHDTINLQVVRITRSPQFANLVSTSAFSGNRLEQVQAVESVCKATPDTLIPQFQIAVDGLTRVNIQRIGEGGENKSNYLQPGYRSDVLVVFPSDGDYCLLDQAAPASERFNPGGPGRKPSGGGQGPNQPQLLAYVHVRGGQAVDGDLQTYIEKKLYDANPTLPEPVRKGLLQGDISPWAPFTEVPAPAPGSEAQKADFTIGQNGFTINGSSYDPGVVNITRQVNTSDDWILTAEGEPHIFHIHVNPFEVMDVTHEVNGHQVSIFDKDGHCMATDTQGLPDQYCSMYHTFRDTVVVQPDYQVHARTYYDRYIGEFVIHCHILDHEDAGMMLNIMIVPNLNAPGGGLGMPDMQHTTQ